MASRVEERERALTESERRFREMADMLPQVIFETDLERTLTYTNRRGYELFGYDPGELPDPFDVMGVIAPER
ncbi:MAG: PAS domain S-box protein, partial [Gemmatimonadales bacterium]